MAKLWRRSHSPLTAAPTQSPRPLLITGSLTASLFVLSLFSTAIGIKCRDGVIVGVEKLLPGRMVVKGTGRRVAAIDEHIGAAVAGPPPPPPPPGNSCGRRLRGKPRRALGNCNIMSCAMVCF
jgi:hypothetical protein